MDKLIKDMILNKRRELNLSQEDMAKALGVSQSQYSRLENKGIDMTIAQFKDICSVLELNIKKAFKHISKKGNKHEV